jgi:hypothetical protein
MLSLTPRRPPLLRHAPLWFVMMTTMMTNVMTMMTITRITMRFMLLPLALRQAAHVIQRFSL